ncbi:MAG: VOC family protein [Bryobacterales bacterium]|nr:VOC family protein [Bryobacterales bacterium]
MYSGGSVTMYVSSVQRAIEFYVDTLGLKLAYKFGEQFASVHAGKGLTIGLHPTSAQTPAGLRGSMSIGLELSGSIDEAVRR